MHWATIVVIVAGWGALMGILFGEPGFVPGVIGAMIFGAIMVWRKSKRERVNTDEQDED